MFRAQISSETEGLRGKMLNDETDLKNQNSSLLEKLENEKRELEAKLKGKFTQLHIKFYKEGVQEKLFLQWKIQAVKNTKKGPQLFYD